MKCLYLDIAHVLHPSVSTHRLVHGKTPWADGHAPYEHLPVLERALAPWPEARIVLSDWTPVVNGLEVVKAHLGSLAERVMGTLFEDITTKVLRTVQLRSGGERTVGYSPDDMRRMNRGEAVLAHVRWCQPAAWVAITSDYQGWPDPWKQEHVVLTDMLRALEPAATQDRLATALAVNFGAPASKV